MNGIESWRMQGRPFDPRRRKRSRGEQRMLSAYVMFYGLTGVLSAYVLVHILWIVADRIATWVR